MNPRETYLSAVESALSANFAIELGVFFSVLTCSRNEADINAAREKLRRGIAGTVIALDEARKMASEVPA